MRRRHRKQQNLTLSYALVLVIGLAVLYSFSLFPRPTGFAAGDTPTQCENYAKANDPYCDDLQENCADKYAKGVSLEACKECTTGQWKQSKWCKGQAAATSTPPAGGTTPPECQGYASADDTYCDDVSEVCNPDKYVEGASLVACHECTTGQWKQPKWCKGTAQAISTPTPTATSPSGSEYVVKTGILKDNDAGTTHEYKQLVIPEGKDLVVALKFSPPIRTDTIGGETMELASSDNFMFYGGQSTHGVVLLRELASLDVTDGGSASIDAAGVQYNFTVHILNLTAVRVNGTMIGVLDPKKFNVIIHQGGLDDSSMIFVDTISIPVGIAKLKIVKQININHNSDVIEVGIAGVKASIFDSKGTIFSEDEKISSIWVSTPSGSTPPAF